MSKIRNDAIELIEFESHNVIVTVSTILQGLLKGGHNYIMRERVSERAFPLNLTNLIIDSPVEFSSRIGGKMSVQDLDHSYSHYTNVVIYIIQAIPML